MASYQVEPIDFQINSFQVVSSNLLIFKTFFVQNGIYLSESVYVSSLERGLKAPTLNKADDLAHVLGIHPLTLLALSYTVDCPRPDVALLMQKVTDELYKVLD